MSQEPTIGEVNKAVGELSEKVDSVLEAIGDFSTKVDERFNKIESRLDKMDGRVDSMDGRLDKMDGRLMRVESQMVTKEYLDDKLINLKADLTVVMRKEDHKLEALTKLLASKKLITEDDANSILALEPFPQRV